MKNKQDRFSQRFLNRSLKRKIDNKENLYDNRPVTAAREGEKIVVKSSPSYTVRIPYTTGLAYDPVRTHAESIAYIDQIKYTEQRVEALLAKYKQGFNATPYRDLAEQQKVFKSAYSGRSYISIYYDEPWHFGERVEVKQSAIVDHIET
jgi:hypothetical protein